MNYKTLMILFVSLAATPALANMKINKDFKTTYPDAKALHNCTTCHDGVPKLNPYGMDVQKNNMDFKVVEPLDSDGDTVINIDEINKGTNPGVKN